jgi:hypothetical protein
MLQRTTISSKPPADPALDWNHLYTLGLKQLRRLARHVWTDHNLHDPGITTLELLCYALTDLGYRASYPIEDLLASGSSDADAMQEQFFTARQILPNRPLTVTDYRKLLIDLPGVKNAWIRPAERTLYADPVKEKLSRRRPREPDIREVHVRGLYEVLVDFMDHVRSQPDQTVVLDAVKERLHKNRNLCEDFVRIRRVVRQHFIVCGELELEPNADLVRIHAESLFRIQQYFAPPVSNYSLSEMRERRKSDGSRYTVEEIFDGPLLDFGFIDDEELAKAELRSEIRLSDVISIVMDIPGVRAVRDLLINPRTAREPLADKWRVPVQPGWRPTLDPEQCRLVSYKRDMPFALTWEGPVEAAYKKLAEAAQAKQEGTKRKDDLPVPRGRRRDVGRYHSFQNHFPVVYGLSEQGLPTSTAKRRALAYQLKAWLLFFDQILANDCAQLARVKELFSTDPALRRTYFYQAVDSFAEWQQIYDTTDIVATIESDIEDKKLQIDRRNRFLDHLIARFAERFHEYAAVTASVLSEPPESLIRVKCDFLRSYPVISADRGLARDVSQAPGIDLSLNSNVSGLQKRLAKLLGIPTRPAADDGERIFLVENILLRFGDFEEPLLPACIAPTCADCADDDPYSYRVHVVLPAYAGRFKTMGFRRFAEEVIRQETPAHVLPKICWVDRETMHRLETTRSEWIEALDTERKARLQTFVEALYAAKSVYPAEPLRPCVPGDERPKFILGRTRLGSLEPDEG